MSHDAFEGLARFYDPLMEHVDYDRWYTVTTQFASLLSPPIKHLDAGCGTGVLLKRLQYMQWQSVGIDLSHAMLHQAHAILPKTPMVAADITALPFQNSFGLITCLFDTINFLLSEEAIQAAFNAFYHALQDGGLLYFDYVTERLVLEHFADQEWHESNGKFDTHWVSEYDSHTQIAETRIRINTGPAYKLYERVYPDVFYLDTLKKAGFTVLGVMDADNQRKPGKRTCRVDVFAAKKPAKALEKGFKRVMGMG
jgi:SAM-dependent methyltransferase